jgi:hypothetical protein
MCALIRCRITAEDVLADRNWFPLLKEYMFEHPNPSDYPAYSVDYVRKPEVDMLYKVPPLALSMCWMQLADWCSRMSDSCT